MCSFVLFLFLRQAIKWIKNKYSKNLTVVRLSQAHILEDIEKSITNGGVMLIEQIEENIDTVLEPLISRTLIKRGRYIRIGNKELAFNDAFKLILHTKLANPHYKPEVQAQTTLINFTVTPVGLEEQLLAEVVRMERPDLEDMKSALTIQQNEFKINLKKLEDDLLTHLASSGDNILDNDELVTNLEATKFTVNEIEMKAIEAAATAVEIDNIRNMYRNAAKRAAILYFTISDLEQINPFYKFSLKSYLNVFKQAIILAAPSDNHNKRVNYLINSITLQTFHYVLKGLFECDKLIFIFHMTLRIMLANKPLLREEIDFLLRFPYEPNSLPPVNFINPISWGGIATLAQMEQFFGIDKDIVDYPQRWKLFLECQKIEYEPLPGEWKHCTHLQKLCILRALRPDRLISAIK